MNVVFDNHDGEDRFSTVNIQKEYKDLVRFFEDGLLELYQKLSKEDLDKTTVILTDARSMKEEASCVQNKNNPNTFLIKMVFSSKADVIEKLAHELCHVMQHLSGALVIKNTKLGVVTWNGEEYKIYEVKPYKRPWEKEAILNAMELHSRYISSIRDGKLVEWKREPNSE